jgi:hypothetical protein
MLTTNHIIEIQTELERNNTGFRKLPDTALKGGAGQAVYTPAQDPSEIIGLLGDSKPFINRKTVRCRSANQNGADSPPV